LTLRVFGEDRLDDSLLGLGVEGLEFGARGLRGLVRRVGVAGIRTATAGKDQGQRRCGGQDDGKSLHARSSRGCYQAPEPPARSQSLPASTGKSASGRGSQGAAASWRGGGAGSGS